MTHKCRLIWITPDAEKTITYCARVSNPANQDNEEYVNLIKYLMKNGHWSPFQMATATIEIKTTRDITRQMLRHFSFSFQEFSQRYAKADIDFVFSEARLQDDKNRQNSIPTDDKYIQTEWWLLQSNVSDVVEAAYDRALQLGIAKEVARKVLPEGMTLSTMYMSGTIRSWIHYLQARLHPSTQKEHREVAQLCRQVLEPVIPNIMKVVDELQ